MFGAVLTLPGIAGILLTLGMAIDANVLIYERLREEQAAGKTLGPALKAAYDKAFSAIFDSNLTTLITAGLLFYMAPVRLRACASRW
jgi:SecD/SecF fusion protein